MDAHHFIRLPVRVDARRGRQFPETLERSPSLGKWGVKTRLDKALQLGIITRTEAFQPREHALIPAPQLCHRPRPPIPDMVQ